MITHLRQRSGLWQDFKVLSLIKLRDDHGARGPASAKATTNGSHCRVQSVRRAKGAVSWQREDDPITVFMGVPTMYSYLLTVYDKMAPEEQAAARAAAARLRLTVSGSAACPLPIMQRWEELSGAPFLLP